MKKEDDGFKPITTEPFKLGMFRGKVDFKVIPNRRSAFSGFEQHTALPCLHLRIATDDEATWRTWDPRGLGFIHQVVGYAESEMKSIIDHFFGNALAFEEAAWRFETNSPRAAVRKSPRAHLLVGHKDLFGEEGLVRLCVNSLFRPDYLASKAVAAAIEGREQEAARVLMSAPTTDSREEVVRNVLRAFDNIRWRMPGAVAQTRSPNSDAHEQLVKAILQEMDTPAK